MCKIEIAVISRSCRLETFFFIKKNLNENFCFFSIVLKRKIKINFKAFIFLMPQTMKNEKVFHKNL